MRTAHRPRPHLLLVYWLSYYQGRRHRPGGLSSISLNLSLILSGTPDLRNKAMDRIQRTRKSRPTHITKQCHCNNQRCHCERMPQPSMCLLRGRLCHRASERLIVVTTWLRAFCNHLLKPIGPFYVYDRAMDDVTIQLMFRDITVHCQHTQNDCRVAGIPFSYLLRSWYTSYAYASRNACAPNCSL